MGSYQKRICGVANGNMQFTSKPFDSYWDRLSLLSAILHPHTASHACFGYPPSLGSRLLENIGAGQPTVLYVPRTVQSTTSHCEGHDKPHTEG